MTPKQHVQCPGRLAYSHSFNGRRWVVTEEFVSGYYVIADFATQAEARDYIETISDGGRL